MRFSKNPDRRTRTHSIFLSHSQTNSSSSAKNLRNVSTVTSMQITLLHPHNVSGIHWIHIQKTRFLGSFFESSFPNTIFKFHNYQIIILVLSFSLGLSHPHKEKLNLFGNYYFDNEWKHCLALHWKNHPHKHLKNISYKL